MIYTKQKPAVYMQQIRRRETMCNTMKSHQLTKEQKEEETSKGTMK